MDILKPEGFAHAAFQILRLKQGASLFLAPVCSSWVWVSHGYKAIKECFTIELSYQMPCNGSRLSPPQEPGYDPSIAV